MSNINSNYEEARKNRELPTVANLRCNIYLEEVLRNNETLRMLVNTLDKMGCDVTDDFFKCRTCEIPAAAFYDPRLGVVLCENRLKKRKKFTEALIHETLHAFDYCRAKIDMDNCEHIACMEIRAEALSGQCRFGNEIGRLHFNVNQQHRECVKTRATKSLSTHPRSECSDNARFYVEKMFPTCYYDYEPFTEIP